MLYIKTNFHNLVGGRSLQDIESETYFYLLCLLAMSIEEAICRVITQNKPTGMSLQNYINTGSGSVDVHTHLHPCANTQVHYLKQTDCNAFTAGANISKSHS